eukprot:jgi/Picsp_1/4755/NSC_02123-R1_protein fam63a
MEDDSACMYQVKHVKWQQRGSSIEDTNTVPIILQDVNGPCPLIAIYNILLLRGSINLPNGIGEISQSRVIQMLAEYLLDTNFAKSEQSTEDYKANLQHNLADAISLLPRLATGIDVNVKFNDIQGMEFTGEVSVFDLLGIELVHGWVVDPQDPLTTAAVGDKTYNELVYQVITALGSKQKPISREESLRKDTVGLDERVPLPERPDSTEEKTASVASQAGVAQSTSENHTQFVTTEALSAALEANMKLVNERFESQKSMGSQDSVSRAISGLLSDTVQDAFKTPNVSAGSRQVESTGNQWSDHEDYPGTLLEERLELEPQRQPKSDDDIVNALAIKEFLESHPNQLTVYGLVSLSDRLQEDQLAVFFRNNHFNVLLKHMNELYILVTDQGYQNEPDIVWERLINVDGDTEFVQWNFQPFAPHADIPPDTVENFNIDNRQQEIADYNLALQLQEQEQHGWSSERQPSGQGQRVQPNRVEREKKKQTNCVLM